MLVSPVVAPILGLTPTLGLLCRKRLAFFGDYFCDLFLYLLEQLAYLEIKLLKLLKYPGRRWRE